MECDPGFAQQNRISNFLQDDCRKNLLLRLDVLEGNKAEVLWSTELKNSWENRQTVPSDDPVPEAHDRELITFLGGFIFR